MLQFSISGYKAQYCSRGFLSGVGTKGLLLDLDLFTSACVSDPISGGDVSVVVRYSKQVKGGSFKQQGVRCIAFNNHHLE